MYHHRIGSYGRRMQRMKRLYFCRSLVPFLILGAALTSALPESHAQSVQGDDITKRREILLGVAHLNFDCYADSVIGILNDESIYVPRFIRWGAPRPGDRNEKSDSTSFCLGHIPKGKKKRQTPITYPAGWRNASASVAFEHLNADTLVDLVIHMRGEEEDGKGRWRRVRHPMVIFGQHGLDTLNDVNLGRMEGFQIEPFFAMELREGADMVEPATRDLSGQTSWILNPPKLDPPGVPAAPAPAPLASIPTKGEGVIRIYPNPAASSALLSASEIVPGTYTVEVLGLNGWVHLRAETRVEPGANLFQTLDVSALPSGYYVVRLTHQGESQGTTHPIIITR